MHTLIEPQPKHLLRAELSPREPLEVWRGLQLHDFHGEECPHTMREVGRLREHGFRAVGAGRGEACDLDQLDDGPHAYRQLIAWDPEHAEVVAVIRYQLGARAAAAGDRVLRTASLFHYSAAFRERCLPYALELGRSVVSHSARRSTLGLFALWRGLARVARRSQELRYFFGNVSIYATYAPQARARLVALVETLYAPPVPMLSARQGLRYTPPQELAGDAAAAGSDSASRIRFLRGAVSAHGERIPPILLAYLGLTRDLWCGETAFDADFGGALELGIIVPLASIEPAVRERFGLP